MDNTILVVMKSTFQQVCFATKQKLPTTLGILHAYAMQHGEGADGVHWIECIFVQKGGTLAWTWHPGLQSGITPAVDGT